VERKSIGRNPAGQTILWKRRDEGRRVVSDQVQLYTPIGPVESNERYVPNGLKTLYNVMSSSLYVIFCKLYHVVIQLVI